MSTAPSAWLDRVHAYVDSLEAVISTVQRQLTAVRAEMLKGHPEDLRVQSQTLVPHLEQLSQLIKQRQSLLEGSPAPMPADTLVAALRQLKVPHAESLHTRCKRLSSDIQNVHRDALALFVAHYHLSQATDDILSLLTNGTLAYFSYDAPGETRSYQPTTSRIFDRAA